jgi:von Willebrand factor type A domain
MDALGRLAHPSKPGTSATTTPPPLTEDFDDFLELFDDLRGLAPASFFLLFKIARVIKTPEAKLNGQLQGFFDVCEQSDLHAPTDRPDKSRLQESVPILTDHDPQFGIRKIKGIEEIPLARPGDVAEEEFTDLMRRAEEGQLNVRVLLRNGQGQAGVETAPITDRGSRAMTNAAEQKLYILMDRSFSMWNHHRLMYAKVLAIEFLRRKKKTGARLFFRGFDFDVAELETLQNPGDYDRLIRKLLYMEPGGKGTDIALALRTAARDIAFDGLFEGAEILLITDGMDRVEPEELMADIGDKIKIHMLKIGRDEADPHDSEVKEMIAADHEVAELSRDAIAHLFQQRLTQTWEQITETLLETDDIDATDLTFGEQEVEFALAAVEKTVAMPVTGLTLADAENAFRKASFLEGFLELLIDAAEDNPAVAARRSELKEGHERLHRFKVSIAAKSGINASLLAAKDLRFVADRSLRKQAKKAKLTMADVGRIQEAGELALQLKLGGSKPSPGEGGMSMIELLRLIAKAAAGSVKGWLFGAPDADADPAEEPSPEAAEGENPEKNDNGPQTD